MRSGPAKLLTASDTRRLLNVAGHSRHPLRNKVIVLLSVRAGLRASEIARLDWSMVTDGRGRVARVIELPGRVVKYGMGRRVPLHAELRAALVALRREACAYGYGHSGPVVASERRGGGNNGPALPMTPKAVVNWFAAACREAELEGCSSHSGRRTFVTKAARLVQKAGGSLRDVQLLAGHRSIETTQAYIEGDADIQRRLVRMM